MNDAVKPAKPKAGYHHGDLREALLLAAEQLLHEKGLQGLTLRACARRAGVSHAAPKHHFADMAELLSMVAARGFDRLTVALQAARGEAGDDPEARFIAVARTYVHYARSNPAHFRLMFRSDVLRQCYPPLSIASARTFAEMTDSITVQRGEPDVAPEQLLQRIKDEGLMQDLLIGWSCVHGYAQLLLEGQLAVFAGEEELSDFLERTLASTGKRLGRLLREDSEGRRED
ncbi:MAG: TetR/AcrR family transcriptional regulator [Pseudomonadales bacterium]